MVTPKENRNFVRVTVTLDPIDVHLIDRLAFHEGANRSQELRGMLEQLRPMLQQLVATFDQAAEQRELLDKALVNATMSELEAIQPEVEEISRRFMGAMAKLEGHAAAASAPASNTGATEL